MVTATDEAQQQSLFLVPDDVAFSGRLYREAPELALLGEELIRRHAFLAQLAGADIRYMWRRKTGVSLGRVKIGYLKRASDLLGHYSGADFILWLSATTARDGRFTDQQVEAAVFHQLCHLDVDDEGNYIRVGHDFEGYRQELTIYGPWTADLAAGGRAFLRAHQLGLFDDVEAEDDEDNEAVDDDE